VRSTTVKPAPDRKTSAMTLAAWMMPRGTAESASTMPTGVAGTDL
jgi:hypothetical protein